MAVDKVVYKNVPNNEKITESPVIHTAPKGFGIRHLQAFLLFISLVVGVAVRTQLSVLMVAMIKQDDDDFNITGILNSTNISDGNFHRTQNTGVYRTYDWNKSTQEIITFAFFFGYTSMQIPMGLIAQKVGGKIPIMVALAVNGILSICTPWIALIGGWIGVSVTRLLQGMTQAAFYPSLHTVLAKWSPLSERGRLSGYIYSGSQIGTIIAFQLSGLLASTPALGWPSSFWMFGTINLIICGLVGWLGAASPHEHSSISPEEIMYIIEGASADIVPKQRKTPWRDILKSPAVWGLICTQVGSTTGYLLILTEIPLYMSGVLGVDIKRNGVYSSLPYIASYIMIVTFGYMADFARNRNIMSVVNIRRTANTIGMFICAIFVVAFSFVNDTLLAVCLLIIALGSHSGIHVGFHINHIDLAPNFAGSIMALGNMMGNLMSLLVPVIVSNIVKDVKNRLQWQIVFIIFAAFQFVTNTIFVIFVKGDVQPWNFYGEENDENSEDLMTQKNMELRHDCSQEGEKKL